MANGDADSGTTPPRQAGGPTGYTTVLRLLPVSYRISLVFLGERRVRHGSGYRCSFTLNSGDRPSPSNPEAGRLRPLDPIPNMAVYPSGTAETDSSVPTDDTVSRPLSNGGDNGDLLFDPTYRVSVVDNHGGWGRDATDSGSTKSRPQAYERNGFNEDIFPDVPFRVIVRKYVGGVQEALSATELGELRVVIEIKDPPEDLSVPADTGQRAFLRNWVERTRTRRDEPGDDNCSTDFRGTRDGSSGAGVTASSVLFNPTYNAQPPVDRPVAATAPAATPGPGSPPPSNPLEDVLTHAQATQTAVSMLDSKRGRTELTGVDEPGPSGPLQVGVSDLIFRPYPASGDNYRFLLHLTDSSGTDVRELELDPSDNFRPVGSTPARSTAGGPIATARAIELRSQSERIPQPHCYTTGKFVIWRRINIRLLVFTNSFEPPTTPPAAGAPPHPPANTIRNAITWADVKRQYREAYIELLDPQDVFLIDEANWQTMLRDYFRSAGVGLTAAQLNAGPYDNFLTAFFPTFLQLPTPGWTPSNGGDRYIEWQWEHIGNLTEQAIRRACSALSIPRPRRNDRQQPDPVNGDGFYVFMTRRMIQSPGRNVTLPDGSTRTIRNNVGGVYQFDRMFHLIHVDTTNIFTHELGHALFLRHGTTERLTSLAGTNGTFNYRVGTGTPFAVSLYTMRETDGRPGSHPHPHEHDQADLQTCIMSYKNSGTTNDYCALCLLTLRHWDLPRIIARQPAATTAGWDPAKIVQISGTTLTESTDPITLAHGSSVNVCTIANMETHNDSAGRRVARVLETVQNAAYSITPSGAGVSVARGADRNHFVITATAAATVQDYQLQFTVNGTTRASRTVRVT